MHGLALLLESLGPLAAGLGLFFIGVKLIGGHLRQLSGMGLRRVMGAAVGQRWRSGLLGTVAGALMQSTNAVTAIVSSLITAGLLSVRQAVPMVAWANVGTSALVLVSTVNLRLGVYYLLGAIGTAYFFNIDQSARYRHVAGVVLGFGLLFLGLQLIKSGATTAGDLAPVKEILRATARLGLLLFLTSLVLTLLLQSSAKVSAIAATMTVAGLLDLDNMVLVILGANAGSGLSVLILSSNHKGSARQLALLQVGTKLAATVLVLLLWWAERHLGGPPLLSGLRAAVPNPALQAAFIFLFTQVLGAVLTMVFEAPLVALAVRWAAPSVQEALAQPQYISPAALQDPATALVLLNLEENRLLGHLPLYLGAEAPPALSAAQAPQAAGASASAEDLSLADQAVSEQIAQFMHDLGGRNPDRNTVDQMLVLQDRLRLFGDLRASVSELYSCLQQIASTNDANKAFCLDIRSGIHDAAHFMLLTLHETAQNPTAQDLEILEALSADRAGTIEGLRKRWLSQAATGSQPMLEALFAATALFERLVWIVRRYAMTLQPRQPLAAG